VDKELAFGNEVLDPVEVHVNSFGSMLSDREKGIIGLDGSCWLWVPHFIKSGAEPGATVVNAGRGVMGGMVHAGT
jgi:hypothetical protein